MSQQQGLLHPLHSLQMLLTGYPPFVADIAGVSVGILSV
jgi:hypothetical protein